MFCVGFFNFIFCFRIDSLDLDPDFTIVGSSSALITSSVGSAIFVVEISRNIKIDTEFVEKKIKVVCSLEKSLLDEILIVKIQKSTVKKSGPFFRQIVEDKLSKKFFDICYNVDTTNLNRFSIVADMKKKLNIECFLKDGQIVNEIKIHSTVSRINITTEKIIIGNYQFIDWGDCSDTYQFHTSTISLICYDDMLKIKLTNKNLNYPTFTIRRVLLNKQQSYLEILLHDLRNYDDIEGIFGKIGQKAFSFHPNTNNSSAQSMKDISIVDINGRKFPVKFLSDEMKNCLYINIKNMLNDNFYDKKT